MARWIEAKHPRGTGGKFAKVSGGWLNAVSNRIDPGLRGRKMQDGEVSGYHDLRDMVTRVGGTPQSRAEFNWDGPPEPPTSAARYLAQQTEFSDPQTGLTAELVATRASAEQVVMLSYHIRDADGRSIGEAERSMSVDSQGALTVGHDLFVLDEDVRGGGFAARWNEHMEQFYRANGVHRIELHANIDVGGYAWAKQGYQFQNYDSLNVIMGRVRHKMAKINVDLDNLAKATHHWEGAALGGDVVAPDKLQILGDAVRRKREQLRLLGDLEYRSGRPEWDSGEAPTPLEIAMAGWTPGAETWPGKEIMLGSNWLGVKQL